jgi:DnaJ-class molecular chaperone
MKQENSEIILCSNCHGKGVIYQEKLTCYHKGEYEYWTEECPKCKGSGLLQKVVVTETIITPFVPLKPDPTRR